MAVIDNVDTYHPTQPEPILSPAEKEKGKLKSICIFRKVHASCAHTANVSYLLDFNVLKVLYNS